MMIKEPTKSIPSRRLARRLIFSLLLASSIITLFITAYQRAWIGMTNINKIVALR